MNGNFSTNQLNTLGASDRKNIINKLEPHNGRNKKNNDNNNNNKNYTAKVSPN